jgi:Kef-type K+ transport system membrane component KefB/Trk K+ transport system NAD-binding subunit
MHLDILTQIAVAIVLATAFAFVAKATRQPLILGYIAAGILIGPTEGFGWISPHDIEPIAELGLILLLFMIGLEIDLKKLRQAGKVVASAGVSQFLICAALGFAVAPLLGFGIGGGNFAAVYFAVAMALSSTMIVVKILYDKSELDTVPGRITLGVLVFQDVWAILFLALQPDLQNPAPLVLLASLAKGVGVVIFALAASRYLLPVLFRSIAKIPELMVLGALGWCFLIVLVAAQLGLSKEMGALIAGVALSTFPYNLDVIAKVISLRDFFITLFFVTLGAQIPRPTMDVLMVALAASAFLVASRFIAITPVLYMLGSGTRVSLIPAINLAQISEFSLVICTLGVGLGHVDQRVLSIVVLTLVITAVGSTYAILYNYEIYRAINPLLLKLGLKDVAEQKPDTHAHGRSIVFLGFFRAASSLLHELLTLDPSMAQKIAVVDFNPEVKAELDRRGISAVYGDVSHPDTLHHAHIHDAEVLLCTIPDSVLKGTTNAQLLRAAASIAPRAKRIVTADTLASARDLYAAGASFVYIPRLMGTRELAQIVQRALDSDVREERERAIAALADRREVLA